ncbi:hypothetical protein AB3R30_22925 [Leptolyngbyaceae cyanobacterium UHCC 1019]
MLRSLHHFISNGDRGLEMRSPQIIDDCDRGLGNAIALIGYCAKF